MGKVINYRLVITALEYQKVYNTRCEYDFSNPEAALQKLAEWKDNDTVTGRLKEALSAPFQREGYYDGQ